MPLSDLFFIGIVLCVFHQESVNKAQVGDDSRGAAETRGRGVQHRPSVGAHSVREEQHAGPHQLPQQQEAARESQGLRQVGSEPNESNMCSVVVNSSS